MKKRSALCFALSFTLALGSTGCSSDDDDGGAGPGGGNPNENMMLSVVNDAIYPIVRDLSVQPYLELLTNPPPVPKALQCQPLGSCSSGSAEYCPTETGFTVDFNACQAASLLDGTISFAGDSTGGAGTLTLTINGRSLAGDVSYTVYDNCVGQSFDQVATTVGTTNLSISGYMEYCNPPAMVGETIVPNYADFYVELPPTGRYVILTVSSDPAGSVEVSFWDPQLDAESQLLGLCHGTIFERLSCSN